MKSILRFLGRMAMGLMIAAIVLWLVDWAIFAVRSARGNAYDTVEVQQFLSTALKGNKEEYDYLGTTQVQCAKALFPRGGVNPCWWQRKHTQVWQ
jgi:hypothetical protein